jgi:alkanesulfonate monooxygenase SsuD/methylene tetrahydromethanopterin reductase-like flavin-dependent oxidoreductase (luciferase family)
MPYPYLPDNFRQRVRSVWVDVPIDYYDAVKGHEVYHTYLDELLYADELGFDGICVNEHHQNAYGLMPSPNLMGSIMARESKQAKIVVMGNSVALYNPPTRVAEEFAMLDVLSGGRLVAGFPVGTPMDSNFCYGTPPAILREKYREGVELIVRAWQEREPFAFNGKYTQLRYVNTWPRPIQQPHPPVWIPGGGSVETWEWTAKLDYVYCYLSYFGYKRGKATMDGFWEAIARVGVDANPFRAGFLQLVCVSETDAQAERDYFQHVHYFYQKCLNVWEGFAEVGAEARRIRQSLDWGQYLDQGYVIAGGPQTVRQQLTECIKSLRVGHLMVLLQIGSMPKELAQKNTALFAQEVMPHVRDLWPGHKDRWWPAGARNGSA